MRFIDISPAVRADTPVWPGDTGFGLNPKWSIDAGDSVTVGTVTTTTHVGAHIDAPSHIVAGAPPISGIPLDACVGPCLVLDVSELVDRAASPHGQPPLHAVRARIERLGLTGPVERLLLRHSTAPPSTWDPDLPGVDPALMRWFAAQGGRLMGLDIASFDPAESTELRCHREAIARGVVLLEGLDLSAAPEGEGELIALPLAWADADASPVRAVLRLP
ncbi:cyclase family protein, partial [Leucobacter soli]|uniref:Kynurenine formamidase n=1 Tax=Leucobacter soli TaxID=2812850 RepID=A0A916NNP5_9MICO|nr:cyclase family protein [Leucobacter soli]CAG7609332.1 Kynurenine formamidase [Leucobacter soli]